MSTLTIEIDARTENDLLAMSTIEGHDVARVASRLLARAVRASRPRVAYDQSILKKACEEFGEEDLLLAESGIEERSALLAAEDSS